MRVLITGIGGFVGSWLARHLLEQDDAPEIHGVVRSDDRRIQAMASQLTLHKGDLRDGPWVTALVQRLQPDALLHLAAWSDVGGSWRQPWLTYEINIQCQLNLLEALRASAPACRTLIIASNEVYGLVQPGDLPLTESAPFRPNSPYGVSKIAQDMMALQYWNSFQMPTIRARSFNHIGPDQSDDFVASTFARQIAEIEAGQRPPILRVGNLDAVRDFTDVRDVVRAYWLLIQRGQAGAVYNVGSGRGRSIRWLLDSLLAMSEVAIEVELDPQRMRPSDVPVSVCDNGLLVSQTGWQPRIALQETLGDVLAQWRQRVVTVV